MRAQEAVTFTNISATTAAFELRGGAYTVDTVATFGGGSVTLQRLGPDGSTYLNASAAVTTNGVASSIVLPPGRYRFLIATATAVYVTIARDPGE